MIRGVIIISVLYNKVGWRPLDEAKRILNHMGISTNGAEEQFTYHITRHVANIQYKDRLQHKPRSLGLVLMVNVNDIREGVTLANTIPYGKHISYIDVSVSLAPERFFTMEEEYHGKYR